MYYSIVGSKTGTPIAQEGEALADLTAKQLINATGYWYTEIPQNLDHAIEMLQESGRLIVEKHKKKQYQHLLAVAHE